MAENLDKERFLVKEVKAKVQVEPKKKKVAFDKISDADDKDYYVVVNRSVDSEFNNSIFVVNHHEEIAIIQGLKNQDNWVLKIDRKLTETTIFQGNFIIHLQKTFYLHMYLVATNRICKK